MLLIIACGFQPAAFAQTLTKANTTTMNTAADWGGTAPTSSGTGVFTNLLSAGNAAALSLGGDVSLSRLEFRNINGPVTIAAGSTLTLGNNTGIQLFDANLNYDVTINAAIVNVGSISVMTDRTLTLGGGATNLQAVNSGAGGSVVLRTGSYSMTNWLNLGNWTAPLTSGFVVSDSGTLTGGVSVGRDGTGILRVNGDSAQLMNPGGTSDIVAGRGSGRGLLQLDRGTITASRNLYAGFGLTTSTANTGIFRMNGGTLSLTGGSADGRLDILGNTTAVAGEGAFELTGGTATVRRLTLGNGSSIGHARMDMTGGTLYITGNSGTGIAFLGTGSATYSITLAGGTIGADDNWSSSADMKLGTTNGSITFQAASASGTARNITLSGVLSNNGAQAGGLIKTASGTLTLSNANTFSGDTQVNGGTLALANVNAIQNSTLDVGAGAVSFTVSGTNTYALAGLKGSGNLGLGVNTISVGAGNANTTFSGVLSGSVGSGLLKVGSGALQLNGASPSFSGSTSISAGRLIVGPSGSVNSTSGITVLPGAALDYNSATALAIAPSLLGSGSANRATLGGTGTINAAVTLNNLGDTLSPGNSPGIMTFGTSQAWNSFTYVWETNNFIGTSAGTDFDRIDITGALNLQTGGAGSYLLDITSLTAGNALGNVGGFDDITRTWTILTTTGGITGFDAGNWTLSTATFTSTPATTGAWSLSQVNNDLVLSYVAVPEPAAVALAGIGMTAAAAWAGRRRRHRSADANHA